MISKVKPSSRHIRIETVDVENKTLQTRYISANTVSGCSHANINQRQRPNHPSPCRPGLVIAGLWCHCP